MPREHTDHSKHTLPATPETTVHMDINQMVSTEIRLVLCAAENGEKSTQSTKTRPGANCGSDHQLLIANFRLKLKETGKNTRPVRYDLNQILYEFAVAVMNRFKGLDLDNTVPEKLWTKVRSIVKEAVNKTVPKKKKSKKAK